ncbi:MAG: histidine--tRNA ligase [Muribaculaceae bacterium]|nr:histidine--tRNA ligase [Muribaculaceae bacterium]
MAQKPSIPKGTRDFNSIEMARRNYIFDTIKDNFKLFGYKQIETPAMENLSTLMGKYGEEGDKLLFKIQNSGDFLKNCTDEELLGRNAVKLTNKMCEKGLRYDLTVPFARFVVQHRNDLSLPFKRFQIQPVWRADRPQKGRYREFYQCDADVVGSDSLLNEVELLSLIDRVFKNLGIRVTVKLNNRKILQGIAESIGEGDKIIDITVAIDKIDKIGLENVNKELAEKGLSEDAISALRPILELTGSNEEKLAVMKCILKDSEVGLKGIEEMSEVINTIDCLGHECDMEIDISLARGLNYYTGTIIEVKAKDVEIGSITGGGRYDNLTGVFGMPGLSGVGISFGADRIYDVMTQLDLFPKSLEQSVKVMFVNFGEREAAKSLKYVAALREAGVPATLYPDSAKLKKQMTSAAADKIPYVAFVGETELDKDAIMIKNMETGEQKTYTLEEAINLLS